MGFLRTAIISLTVSGVVLVGPFSAAMAEDEIASLWDQAKQAYRQSEYQTVITRINTLIDKSGHQSKYYGLRAAAWLKLGDLEKGILDLEEAIALNPGDAGQHYHLPEEYALPPESIAHGQHQLVKMLQDRPAMAEYNESDKFLRAWAIRQFAGESLGSLIDWDASAPLHSDAEHLAPSMTEHAAILVAATYDAGANRGKTRSFEELWAGAVFELHNVCFAHHFVRLNDEATAGTIARDAFVAEIVKYELQAAQQTRAFYTKAFLPWAKENNLATNPSLWFIDWWDSPETVMDGFPDKSAYPWRPYVRNYDWTTFHRYWHQLKYDEALRLLEQMDAQPGYEEDDADICYWAARCLQQLGKLSDALDYLNEAIRIEPENADALRARSEVKRQLGEEEQADKDLKKADELEQNPPS